MSIPVRSRNLVVLDSPPKTRKHSGPSVDQLKLETILGMRRQLRELEESIGLALSKGAHVEPGIHTAQLVPERRRGEFFMKLVILIIFLAMLPALCSRAGAFEDVNRDGKIDALDFLESASSPDRPVGKREATNA